VSVDTLVVVPRWRRSGVATALMRACEERARGWGAARIELIVYEVNEAARALYDRLGYETLSRRLSRRL
jgi:ribosomal protein S18 acetylase RimI-like enzyme